MRLSRMQIACWALLFVAYAAHAQAAPAGKSVSSIAKGKKVSFEYTLFLENQEKIAGNIGQEPLIYEHGAQEIIPGLERALEGMKSGDRKKITIKPEDGYGPLVNEAIVEVETAKLPRESRAAGAMVQLNMPDGEALEGLVTRVDGAKATVDFNHPLAGKTLYFDVKVLAVQ